MPSIIDRYIDGSLKAWPGKAVADTEFERIGDAHNFVKPMLALAPGQPRRSVNYKAVRKALGGKDIPNIPQEIGDCVAWGGRNAAAITGCVDIVVRGEAETWKDPFPPFYYGTSRVQIGGGRISGDGSVGSWLAAAVMKYGTVYTGDPGVPAYSGDVATKYGRVGPPRDLLDVGKNFLIKSAVPIKNWEDAVTYCVNGWGLTIASDVGFSMEPDSKGFHRRQGSWAHQMCVADIDDEWTDPYVIIRNSWGDVHGRLKDFHDNETLPVGCLRVRRRDFEVMLAQSECFAFTQYEQPRSQDVNESLYKLW